MSTPRIISGSARGRRLKAVPGDTTRPITDLVKEALFNIIGADIQTATLLDLFAGTGSVSIEALSRGAEYARMIDKSRLAARTIIENLDLTRLRDKADVVCVDSFTYLRQSPDRAFDYIYIAPPQYKDLWRRSLALVDENIAWLGEDGWVIAQIDPVENQPVDLSNLVEFSTRRYGNTLLLFYERKNG